MLVEDACQVHGAEYHDTRVGSFGTGCFLFYATKNMTTAEGGMITTNDRTIAQRARMVRSHGQTEKYLHEIIGYNYRMNELSAALGICALERVDKCNALRSQNASVLSGKIGEIKGLTTPFVMTGVKHAFHQFTIRVVSDFRITRNELEKRLGEKGIGSAIHYPIPIHKKKVYQNLCYSDHLPVSEKAAQEVLSLLVPQSLTVHCQVVSYMLTTHTRLQKHAIDRKLSGKNFRLPLETYQLRSIPGPRKWVFHRSIHIHSGIN